MNGWIKKNKHINTDKYPRVYSTRWLDNMLKSGSVMFVPQADWYKLESKYNRLMKRYLKLKKEKLV